MSQGPESLANAIALAADVHRNQVDKGGEPYILHPLRVMADAMAAEDGSWNVGIVAVLHDTIEDNDTYSDIGLREMIAERFGPVILDMILILTKLPGEDYFKYIERIKESETWCIAIKLADLRDNMTILRQPTLNDKDMLRIQKYHMAYRMLDERY